jgi:putative FmdB family regulatory protein
MPLYEYKCKQCGRHTEKRQKFSDVEITECPHCSGLLERVISAPAISFKGSGWYKDLYSSPKAAASSAASESGSSADSSKKEGSSASSSETPATGGSTPAPAAPPASAPAKATT